MAMFFSFPIMRTYVLAFTSFSCSYLLIKFPQLEIMMTGPYFLAFYGQSFEFFRVFVTALLSVTEKLVHRNVYFWV